MSCVVSIKYTDGIRLMTDGLAYDLYGVVTGKLRKVWSAKAAPVAVAGRGSQAMVDRFAKSICGAADNLGVDEMLRTVEAYLCQLRTRQLPHFELLIAVWSESSGARHFIFTTHEKSKGFEPWCLIEQPEQVIGAPQINPRDVSPPITTAISDPLFLQRHGADMMELMRRCFGRVSMLHDDSGYGSVVGGQCDLTTVTANGVETVTLRTWHDRVGEKIQPFGRNVVPMNRQQRRALERQHSRA